MTVRMAFAGTSAALPASAKLARDAFYIRDDFARTSDSNCPVGGTGSIGYTSNLATGHPGVVTSNITAVADSVSIVPATSHLTAIAFGAGQVEFEHASIIPTVEDANDRWSDRCGVGDVVGGADFTDGVYLETDLATHGDANVRLCAANNGVRTKTSLGVSITAATWERWGFVVNQAGTSVQAYRNGVAVGAAVTTNIPTTSARVAAAYNSQVAKTLGIALRQIARDYIEVSQAFSPSR